MTLPLLAYAPSSQNQRVEGYEVPGDEHSGIFTLNKTLSTMDVDVLDVDALILAAYRQIFHEQQMLKSNRQTLLESQLRGGLISVKGFVRGLATSDAFRTWNYEVNNNYRFVELCVQRLLGRNVYDDKETLAWSIVLATKGVEGLVDALMGSEEYATSFGDDTVPYQRRRVLPQHALGDLPFERVPRYTHDHLTELEALGYNFSADRRLTQGDWMETPDAVRKAAGAITAGLAIFLSLVAIATIFSWFSWISL
ncbi:phycobilisome rod-core linker polypeptide [Phormidium tenue]|uniref:Phycobilisome rod-core linker polypeptide CpcG n=1 Tax=Phormidium tenue NIES-30 TaxID=549789 RepID=A0A1U7JB82_9CYAN|nr:phycobilisome rod-core linker polypeptide [Phormidium tenue]MBD2230124.1 phycobilisome rod-core linker polypeptide [Phormidium tenue FACHB-1052]OKH51044.1 phycobilisome rod-core linker polypeptide CpcG [Phormidium tenue NIES-30]